MNSEMAIAVESSMKTVYARVTVLLVDGDSTSLTIISKMLRRFGYGVMTANRATDAFCMLRDGRYKIDLILAEARLPDMDQYELLETLREMPKLPVILMFANYNENAMVGGLYKGAKLCLVKPIIMNDLKNLWQFPIIKQRENAVVAEEISDVEGESSLENASGEDVESQPRISKWRRNVQSGKRKRSNEIEIDLEKDNDVSAVVKKPKLIWTRELHNRFLQAIRVLGAEGARPMKILQQMNVPGLKKGHVSSHLQKFRLSLKQKRDAIQKTMNRGSTALHVPSHNPFFPFSPQEGFLKFPHPQSMAVAGQPVISGLTQENLNGLPSIAPEYLPMPIDSSRNDASTIKFQQQVPCNKQPDFTYPVFNQTCDRVTNNGLVDFHQMENSEQFLLGETDLLNIGASGSESTLHCTTTFDGSLQEKQQSVLPEPLQPPAPPQEEDHDIFGAEKGGDLDELFTLGEGTSQLFPLEDFEDIWLD
ncbi:hypothetical protein DITRI_Ditri13aG0030900 [Diplodiscus trichospermus]